MLKFSDFCNYMNVEDEEKARPLSEVIANNIAGDYSEENFSKKRKKDERSFDDELPSSYKEFEHFLLHEEIDENVLKLNYESISDEENTNSDVDFTNEGNCEMLNLPNVENINPVANITDQNRTFLVAKEHSVINESAGNGGKNASNLSKSSRKRKLIKSSYPLLSPCDCKMNCLEKIDEDRRKAIHAQFWCIENRNERIIWINGNIEKKEVKVRREKKGTSTKNRHVTRAYKFPIDGKDVFVCQKFFLRTLGYKHDTILTKMFKNMSPSKITPRPDQRGKHVPKHALDQQIIDTIDNHIDSFHPAVSHYRREHCPLRLYLAPELSIQFMLSSFQDKYPDLMCSLRSYSRRVKKKNISFCKLGEEECEVCEAIEQHTCSAPNRPQDLEENDPLRTKEEVNAIDKRLSQIQVGQCNECDTWADHIKKAKISRHEYKKDRDTYPDEGVHFFSADMQKVIMIPRLPGNKSCVFTRRLTVYHETYAPLIPNKKIKMLWQKEGKQIRKEEVIGTIWHEAIQGRNDEDVVSSFIKVLQHPQYRDAKEIVQWCDNCAGQMKNWTFFCAVAAEVNKSSISKITIKYFEKGHTFMSADSFHALVEKNMRRKKNVYDFQDFADCISQSGKVLLMQPGDFIDFEKKVSSGKDTNYPLIKDMAVVQFRKGSTKIFWKKSHEESEFEEGEFMIKKHRANVLNSKYTPVVKQGPRGIESSKKDCILTNLGPMMPENRHEFWKNLNVCQESDE